MKKPKEKISSKKTVNLEQENLAKANTKSPKLTIVLLLLAIIILSIASFYAYSKYTRTLTGSGTATVAKWSFKVNGQTETIGNIDLGVTAYNNVADQRIAPGTSGQFDLILDGSGSEVAIDYSIDLNITNNPRNLKFYTDSGYKNEIENTNGKMNVKGTIALEDVNTPLTRTIYWNWPYQTGTTENEIAKNDEIDTDDSGKNVTMAITVTGTQRDPSSTKYPTLAELVKVGDYVNYEASSGTAASYTTDSALTGSTTQTTFSSSDSMKWRVLSVDKTSGIVELMSADPTAQSLTLSGKEGYKNAENILNDIGAVYGHGKGAVSARSMNIDDVEKYSSYDKANYTSNKGYKYGATQSYTSGTFINEDGTEVTASTESPVKMTQTYYGYTAQDYFANEVAYNMIFKQSTNVTANKPTFWLASRCVYLFSNRCGFDVRYVHSGGVNDYYLFFSSGSANSPAHRASPLVSLKSNIQTSGKDASGAWNLIVE